MDGPPLWGFYSIGIVLVLDAEWCTLQPFLPQSIIPTLAQYGQEGE